MSEDDNSNSEEETLLNDHANGSVRSSGSRSSTKRKSHSTAKAYGTRSKGPAVIEIVAPVVENKEETFMEYPDVINYREVLLMARCKKKLENELAEAEKKKKKTKSRKKPPPKPKRKKVIEVEPETQPDEEEEEEEEEDDQDDEETQAAMALQKFTSLENARQEQIRCQNEAVRELAAKRELSMSDVLWCGVARGSQLIDNFMGYDGQFGEHIAGRKDLREICDTMFQQDRTIAKTIERNSKWVLPIMIAMEYFSYRNISFSSVDDDRPPSVPAQHQTSPTPCI